MAFDDELLVLDNPHVHGLTSENITAAFTTFDPELYIPLTLLTYQIEWSLVGDAPWLYHLTNLLLHLASTAFVFMIARRFFTDRVSAACALLFALHPVQVEAVAWISGRKDLLASMFFLASAHTYLLWKDGEKPRYVSVGLFVCGLLSKVSVFPLPFALLLFDVLAGYGLTRESVKEKWPYFFFAAFFLIVALVGKQAQVATDPLVLLLLAPASLALSLLHIVYPVSLTIFYPFTDPVSVMHPQIAGGSMLLLMLASAGWTVRRKTPEFLIALAWFLLLTAPSLLNMFKGGELGVPDVYLTSDRYVYLSVLGPVLFLGMLMRRYGRLEWAAVPVLVLFAALTVRQLFTWQNSEVLFRRVVDAGQPAHVAYTNLGGYAAQAKEYEEAESLYEQSLAIRRTSRVLQNLIQIKGALGKKDEARALLDEYIRLRPGETGMHERLRMFTE